MTNALFDNNGQRKYLVSQERLAFVTTAARQDALISTFCFTMAFTGARISEVLALTPNRVDAGDMAVIFRTLKQRGKTTFRAVPIPAALIALLVSIDRSSEGRIWPWGRTTAWKYVKAVMREAGIVETLCKPKALRHALGVEAGQKAVPLNIVQRWLGHARLETTAIYANAIGDEERNLAHRAWSALELALPSAEPPTEVASNRHVNERTNAKPA